MTIPLFSPNGLLAPGTYSATFEEIRESVLVRSPIPYEVDGWDMPWRARLVDRAEKLVGQLWATGVTEIFLDGSFAEAKPHPNDIDGYFECDPRTLVREIQPKLNAIDPYKVWTWAPDSRRPAAGSMKWQLPMWHRYRVELYPHYPGLLSGLRDADGHELPFPSAFRQQRGTGLRKGIVKVVR